MKISEIDNNINNYEKYMTIYYNKKTGLIVGCPTGIHDMSNYRECDPALLSIWDYEILPLDLNVIYNRQNFRFINGELRLVSDLGKSKYKTIDI